MCLLTALTLTGVLTSIGTGAAVIGDIVGTVAGGLAIAGGVMSTVDSVQQAKNSEAMATYQAELSEENSRLAAREAENIQLQGDQDRAKLRRESLATLGSARAGYAAQGVVLGQGTTADYEADVADTYDLDRRNLDYEINTKAWQQKVAAVSSSNQASLYRAQAESYNRQAKTSLLSGVFNTAGSAINSTVSGLGTAKKFGLFGQVK